MVTLTVINAHSGIYRLEISSPKHGVFLSKLVKYEEDFNGFESTKNAAFLEIDAVKNGLI